MKSTAERRLSFILAFLFSLAAILSFEMALRWSLGLSAAAMCVCTAVVAGYIAAGTRRSAKMPGEQEEVVT